MQNVALNYHHYELTSAGFMKIVRAPYSARAACLAKGLIIGILEWAIALAIFSPLLFILAVSCASPSQPQVLKAKPVPVEDRNKICEKISRTDDDFAKCMLVKWERLE